MDFVDRLKNLFDPGMVSSYYPQVFPGHPAAQELEYRNVAPPGTDLVAGVASGLPLAMAAQRPFRVSWRPDFVSTYDKSLSNRLLNWLSSGKKAAEPSLIFRGIPKGAELNIGEEYAHATPWLYSAFRGGKGIFGDPSEHDVYAFKAAPRQLYYRGGSLVGDPLESTRINSARGMTWDEILNVANILKSKNIAEPRSLLRDIRNATFETDVLNRPGIWSGRNPPPGLKQISPELRSVYDILGVLKKKKEAGLPLDELLNLPEAKILGRSEHFKGLLDELRR